MFNKKQYRKISMLIIILSGFFILTGFKLVAKQNEIDSTEILIKEKKYFQAEEVLNLILKDFQAVNDDNPESPEVTAKNILTPQIYFKLGDIQFKQRKYEDAIIYFDKVINISKNNDWNIQALLFAGQAEYYLKKYSLARGYYSRLINDYRNSTEAQESLYYIGLCYEMEENKEQAAATFKKFLNLYPKHPWAGKVKGKIGKE